MKWIRLLSMAALLTLGAVGCRFKSDFSGLEFSVDTGAQDVAGDQVALDLSGEDQVEVVPDSAEPDQSEEPKSCIELLTCVLFEHRCPDFSDFSCPNVCADTDQWEENALFYKIYSALGSCQLSGTSDAELLPCLYVDHATEMAACLGEEPLDLKCPDAVRCMLGKDPPCASQMQPKPYFGCLSNCATGISAAAQKGLAEVLSGCPSLVPGAQAGSSTQIDQECVEGLQECFGDSGNRSCNSMVSCMVPMCLKCADGTAADQCRLGPCVADCLVGASSEKAVELALGSIAGPLVAESNIFASLIAYTKCIDPSSGSQLCTSIYDELADRYVQADPHAPDEYDTWIDIIAGIRQSDLSRLQSALDCLRIKWDPSTQALNVLAWQTCRTYCN